MAKKKPEEIRVLIADDEVEFASTLATRLKLRKYDAFTAMSGRDTLELAIEKMPDILLLDLKMPDMDGLEVLALLRERCPDMRVIIVTGHGSFDVGVEGMQLGAFDYLMKPIDLGLLIEKIHDALGLEMENK